MKLFNSLVILASSCFYGTSGFAPVHKQHFAKSPSSTGDAPFKGVEQPTASSLPPSRHLTAIQAENNESIEIESGEGFSINPPYAIAFVTFLSFAFYRSFTEADGASMKVLEGFFADPLNPGCNELFATIFNLLGLYFVPLACLLMPGAKGQKLPATPFVLASMLGGYGFLGPYMITRKPAFETVNKSDLGFVTSNILENKIVNWGLTAVIASAYVSSGFFAALVNDPNQLINGYADLFSQTAIASASSMDFLILTLVAASLIPEDLARRGVKEGAAPYAVAASTLLWPCVGVALYCALRPELEE